MLENIKLVPKYTKIILYLEFHNFNNLILCLQREPASSFWNILKLGFLLTTYFMSDIFLVTEAVTASKTEKAVPVYII